MITVATIESKVMTALRKYGKLQMYQFADLQGAHGYNRNDIFDMVGKWADDGKLVRSWDDRGEVFYTLPTVK